MSEEEFAQERIQNFSEEGTEQYKEPIFNFVTSQSPPPWPVTEDDMRPYEDGEIREWKGDIWCYTSYGCVKKWVKR